jgi:hypothetical protein
MTRRPWQNKRHVSSTDTKGQRGRIARALYDVRSRAIGAASTAAAVGCLLVFATGVAPAALRTMPVSEIRPGMKGHGLSVFRGSTPERFDIEVIDVLSNFRPDQDLVLIKTLHPLLEHTRSVAGMSGSPVYIDGRLIGAYAYGWPFGLDPIAGVTPIKNMLAELDRPTRPLAFPLAEPLPRKQARVAPPEHPYEGLERRGPFYALDRRRPATEGNGFVRASTPLLVGGMTREVASLLGERFAPLGLDVLEAAGSGKPRTDGPSEYVDGGSIAVTLLRGDVQATAVGTVTYVAGKRAVAFGHPMLDAGEVGLPTATSRVLHVLASERSSFKIAEALRPLGALVHDRQSAIVIDNGVTPRTIPLAIRIRGVPGLPRETWNVEAVHHRMLTPPLVLSAIASALGATLNDVDDTMFKVESVVQVKGHAAQKMVDTGFTAAGMSAPAALMRLRLFDLLEATFGNPFERAVVERISVDIDVRFGREVTEILGAQLASHELDPGEPARVMLTLRPFAGPIQQRLVEVPLPASLAGEQVELEFAPGDAVRPEQVVPRSLDDIFGIIGNQYPATSLVVGVQRKARGVSLSGHVVNHLPASALDVLATAHDTSRTPLFITQDRLVLPMGRVLTGQTKLAVEVRKEKR